MSTRLYFNGGATAIAPARDPSWEATAGGLGPLTPAAPLGVALQNLAGATALNSPAGAVDVLLAQWISPPLRGSGTITGQIKGQLKALESATAADLRARSDLTTEQLIYVGRAAGWLLVPSLDLELADIE